MIKYKILLLELSNKKIPYLEWFNKLDTPVQQRIDVRLDRIEQGNLGDYKVLSENLFELRLKFGSGYRIYFTIEKDSVLLLCGGNKSTQKKDIRKAAYLLRLHQDDHHNRLQKHQN